MHPILIHDRNELQEGTLSKQREYLREWEMKLQAREERLAKRQRIPILFLYLIVILILIFYCGHMPASVAGKFI